MIHAGPPQGANAPLGGAGSREGMDKAGPRAPRVKVERRAVHGLLLLDKPLGLSSNQALQKAKWLLRADKAGHTGTLDPLATGVLPLCFGAATKFSQMHLDATKRYRATLQLGVATTTGDREGEVLATQPVPAVSPEQLAQVAARFHGTQRQLPPMYSALKKDGRALYDYARAGESIEREHREIQIHALNVGFHEDSQAGHALVLDVTCSKGTYIRTLGEDIAQALGTVGHLTALRRVATGPYTEAQCITLNDLEALDDLERLKRLQPVDALLTNHTPVMLAAPDAGRFLSGMRRRLVLPDQPNVGVFTPAAIAGLPPSLLGTAHLVAGELIPDRLLNPPEIEQIARQFAPSVAA